MNHQNNLLEVEVHKLANEFRASDNDRDLKELKDYINNVQ